MKSHFKPETPYQEFLSRPELNFWIPIITSLLMVASSFFLLYTKVELLNQKVDNISANIDRLTTKYASVEDRYGKVSLQIQRIETVMNLQPLK